MLLRFAAANHRSILEPIEFSMIAVDTDRPSARRFDLLNEGVLSIAGIYGANASGKSNILDALLWLASAVDGSLRLWDQFIPRDPFRFGEDQSAPSTFEIEMMVQGIRYTYTLALDDQRVISETLQGYPEKKPRTIMARDREDIELRRGIGGATAIKELMTDTTLALSVAMRLAIEEIEPFARSLAGMSSLGVRPTWRDGRYLIRTSRRRTPLTEHLFADFRSVETQPSLFDDLGIEFEDPRKANYRAALGLLKYADLGIDGVDITDESVPSEPRTFRRTVKLLHRVGDRTIPLEMFNESEGTQTWFRLIGPVLSAIQRGQVVVVDEIDASLHPRLSATLLDLFQDPKSNPRNAQLIFTTHDTSLLNHLNRDEVWLTEKTADGSTRLIALADYGGEKVRKSLNLEKAYLQGRFGGVPETDQVLLRRALGMLRSDD
jgi:AAA15 family ATPase/GTPase